VSLGASIADAIAALHSDAEKETLVIAGGGKLLDGLLAAAAGGSAGEEREAAERALLNLLATRAQLSTRSLAEMPNCMSMQVQLVNGA